MFLGQSTINIKNDFDKIKVFFFLHLFLFLTAKFYELLKYEFSFLSILGFIAWILYSRLFYRMIKNLYYSFWSMLAVSVLFIISDLYSATWTYKDWSLFYFYMFSLICLGISAKMLRTPLFYPVVSWWEYDFRYRNDIKVHVSHDDKNEEGRIVDLRGTAGGLSYFEDLEIGKEVTVHINYNELEQSFKAEIVSKRQHSIGRPYTYGVRFHFENDEDKNSFSKLIKYWCFERKYKQQAKLISKSHE